MSGTIISTEPDESKNSVPVESRHQALLEVSESIALHSDLAALFHALAERLPRVVSFDSLWLVLHDTRRNTMRLHILETPVRAGVDVIERSVEDSPSGLVWQTQQPLLVPDIFAESRFPEAFALLRESRVESFCIFPLTTPHGRLGAVGFGSQRQYAYRQGDVDFLQLVAKQVAVAVDNTLSHQDAETLRRQLQLERDRLRLLLDLNNSMVSNLDLRELLGAISTGVRRVMRCDYASVTLPEPGDNQQLRVYARDFAKEDGSLDEEIVVPVDASLSGEALRLGKPMVLGSADLSQFSFPINRALARLKSMVLLPLTSRNRTLGTLNLGSCEDGLFSVEDVAFLRQVSSQVAIAVENALDYRQIVEARRRLAEERVYLNEEIRTEHDFEEIIGESVALGRVLAQVETVAPTDSTVLIYGETGTGKELIARAIHDLSSRSTRTFVRVNCAAIPLGLLESELFGHEKGAFTGAIAQKIGRFELAHQGTLFLDEVGDIPLELQPKLLRVLQEQEFERLGGNRTIRVRVRVIAATSRNLEQMIAGREFRSDLYYRLNVFPVQLPPLRERPEDIPLLVGHFADRYARRMNKRIELITPETMDALVRYDWPGNVRELQNFIERAVILSPAGTLHAPLAELKLSRGRTAPRMRTLAETEREQILQALTASNWVLGGPDGAAERLGLKRTTLYYRMRRLGIPRTGVGEQGPGVRG